MIERLTTHAATAVFAMIILATAVSCGMAGAASGQREPIYQTDGKGMERVSVALAAATQENKRVLLKIGGNWCGWCFKLHDTLHKDKTVSALLDSEYVLVMIDNEADKAVIEKWKITPSSYPHLAVLDASGEKLTEQETGSLEAGPAHDSKKVAAFLEKWKAPPAEAAQVFERALAQAAKDEKKLFVRVGAPWCGWCRRLDAYLAEPAVLKLLEKDFVLSKIDTTRMRGAEETVAKIRKPNESGGIPWFAFLESDGTILATSTVPGGNNIGFPVDPDREIPHFKSMLEKARVNMSDADIATLIARLVEIGKKK